MHGITVDSQSENTQKPHAELKMCLSKIGAERIVIEFEHKDKFQIKC